ncbi:uncharacterized protein MONOS_9550 [Monocercomonoides exilis]|uniref:uncharacterized protein n=1 Tax=Monocercomonoides exilis TaxID=2049356 RepID=UPI00355A79B5|nr:hypothetical protein MONOS_9550 [Monocercomonoides exilis]|eukprot:MONOS_9550.1-p1 / transcript=MONOS_9550.1 / gene=MONOS_9550 / organism=Monocercomonoides_exilis_PA203 / gene_product=unspecified product / transcript_product=unspecified product / location=Mono_scaffold00398:53780-55296(-) / protein_length=489 / sequence_SO=supercontig / SO=protein_coding / is_pseudo=false
MFLFISHPRHHHHHQHLNQQPQHNFKTSLKPSSFSSVIRSPSTPSNSTSSLSSSLSSLSPSFLSLSSHSHIPSLPHSFLTQQLLSQSTSPDLSPYPPPFFDEGNEFSNIRTRKLQLRQNRLRWGQRNKQTSNKEQRIMAIFTGMYEKGNDGKDGKRKRGNVVRGITGITAMREREKEKWKEKLKEREKGKGKEKEKREKFPGFRLLGDWVEHLDTDEAVDECGVNPLTLENYSSSNTINTFGFFDYATFLIDDFLFEQVLNNGDGILRRRFVRCDLNPSYVPRRQRQRKINQNSTQTFLTHSTAGIGTRRGTSPSSLYDESFLSLCRPSPSPSSSSSSSSPAVTDLSLHPKPPHRSEIAMARRIRAMHPLLRRRYLNRCAQVAAASGASRSSSSSSSSSLLRSSGNRFLTGEEQQMRRMRQQFGRRRKKQYFVLPSDVFEALPLFAEFRMVERYAENLEKRKRERERAKERERSKEREKREEKNKRTD